MMDDDQPRKDRDPHAAEGSQDDLDGAAILARRRMFVASALAGMSLSAASCEAQVSGSVSVSGGASAGGNSGTVAQPTGNGDGSGSNSGGTMVPQVCLMFAARPEDSGVLPMSELDAGTSGHVNVMPCLMVAAPSLTDAGVRSDARGAAPTVPIETVMMPCLSTRPPDMDAGNTAPQACLRMVAPRRDAGAPSRADAGAARDTGVMPRPCLEMVVPQPCLSPPINPRIQPQPLPQPCLTPVRKDTDEE
jgi:hypothetical protein